MKSFLTYIFGIWIVLFALFLPFTYNLLPAIGIELTNGISSISEWIATTVFQAKISVDPITSDSVAQFVQALLLLIFAFIFAIILKKQKRFPEGQITQFLHTAAAYILSLFLLKYGVDKLFQFQFYPPEPNTLFTPLGMLSKDILFWSSMGTSSTYNTFMGLIEVIPAILLLHHRTRMLGAFIALGVLVNVFFINVGFDITVKLLSIYLVVVSLFALSPFFKNLVAFFITHTQSEKPNMHLSLKPKVHGILKAMVVILLFTEVLYTYVERGSFNGRTAEKIQHFGSYELTQEGQTIFGIADIQRIHIHSKGYLVLENKNNEFIDFPILIAPDQSVFASGQNARIFVMDKGEEVEFRIQQLDSTRVITCVKVELDMLPALDDTFHWTIDKMVGDHQ